MVFAVCGYILKERKIAFTIVYKLFKSHTIQLFIYERVGIKWEVVLLTREVNRVKTKANFTFPL